MHLLTFEVIICLYKGPALKNRGIAWVWNSVIQEIIKVSKDHFQNSFFLKKLIFYIQSENAFPKTI